MTSRDISLQIVLCVAPARRLRALLQFGLHITGRRLGAYMIYTESHSNGSGGGA